MGLRGMLVRTLALGTIGAAVTVVALTPLAGACSIGVPAASMTFFGTLSAIDPSAARATFHIETVESTESTPGFPGHPQPPVLFPGAGDTTVVSYATDVDALDTGARYRVTAFTPSASEITWESTTLASFVRTPGGCGSSESPARTTYADGSRIEATLRYDARRFAAADLRWQVGVAAGIVGIAISGAVLLRRRRGTSGDGDVAPVPGLDADGRPRDDG